MRKPVIGFVLFASTVSSLAIAQTTPARQAEQTRTVAQAAQGPVAPASADAIMRAVDAAIGSHLRYLDAQRALVAAALGPDWRDAPDRAADAILRFVAPRAGPARRGSGRRKTALLPPHPRLPYEVGGR